MTALLREPLVHFLGLGALIFVLFLGFDDTPTPAAADRIEVTQADAERLRAQFEATWRRPPTTVELQALLTAFVREEVLVREALALGLDRDDAVVRQRMAQKLTVLIEGGAEATAVSTETLAAHLAAYPERFERPARIDFSHVLLREEVTTERALQVVRMGSAPTALGRQTLLPERLSNQPASAVDATFGPGMFDAVAGLAPGTWSGPIESAFGRHMVFVHSLSRATLPDLADIRDRVELDWRSTLRAQMVAERIDVLLAGYEVILPDLDAADP